MCTFLYTHSLTSSKPSCWSLNPIFSHPVDSENVPFSNCYVQYAYSVLRVFGYQAEIQL